MRREIGYLFNRLYWHKGYATGQSETEKLYKLRSETADWVACCCNEEKGEVYLFMSEDSKIEVMVFSRE